MTERAEIERLLNQTGRTLEGLPTETEYLDLENYGARCEELDRYLSEGGFKLSYPCLFHQSDVIELLVGALRDALDKPMQKPLTLGDVLKIDDYGEAWWVEYESGLVTPTILNNDYHQYGEQLLDGFAVKLFDYGKVWRCWATRPTDEERKAAAWED